MFQKNDKFVVFRLCFKEYNEIYDNFMKGSDFLKNNLRMALLIDAENISVHYHHRIVEEATLYGPLVVKRIYGDFSAPEIASWKAAILYHALKPIQQFSWVAGKNSSDSALLIDAMDLLCKDAVDGFCLVSSDSDFIPLAARLREGGKFVLGMGETKTPRPFIAACQRFLYLDGKEENSFDPLPSLDAAVSSSSQKKIALPGDRLAIPMLKKTLLQLARKHSDKEHRILASQLRTLLAKECPDFDPQQYGHTKFLPFIQSLGIFRVSSLGDDTTGGNKTFYFEVKGSHAD